jgi:anaerobic selenocysteine-containing dehydrogenase
MENPYISRRKFVNLGLHGTAGIGLASSISGGVFLSSCMDAGNTKTAHGACYHDCPDTCSWTATSQNGKITEFKASTSNPFTAGKLCSKMDHFPQDVTFHPDRILTPLRRIGQKGEGKFEKISWEQAISEVAEKLTAVIDEYGKEAVLPYSFAGTEGLVQKNSISARFFAHTGASKLSRTICGDAAVTGVLATNGQTTGVLPEDIIYSKYIIIWGTNPVISNQHLWPFLEEARKNGAKVVVIDPFKSKTAASADWHIQPWPGTDTALALGLMHVILKENLHDQDYIEEYTLGIDALTRHVENYNPQYVAELTGLGMESIIELARQYAQASPSLIRVLIGMEHQAHGAGAFQAVAMLPALTGAWKHRGGGLMHMTYELFGEALNWERLNLAGDLESPETRTISMIQIGKALTDPAVGIHAIFVYNSNPAVIAPNQNLVIKGLAREDLFTVVLEHFITDTARYADYVFPATSQLEHWDLMTSWGQTYINLNQPVIDPVGEAKPNTEFFRLLAKEMNFSESYLYESDIDIIKKTLVSNHPYMQGITFDYLKKHGWAKLRLPDPWMPFVKGSFGTPSGKCEFYSSSLQQQGLPPMPDFQPAIKSAGDLTDYPLRLLTVKSTSYFLNTSHANVGHLQTKEGEPYLDINVTDAEKRGISDGDELIVFNQLGKVLIKAKVSNRVGAGVVCMPQGYWSSLMKGGSSANALTTDSFTDMGEGAAFHETNVEVAKAGTA